MTAADRWCPLNHADVLKFVLIRTLTISVKPQAGGAVTAGPAPPAREQQRECSEDLSRGSFRSIHPRGHRSNHFGHCKTVITDHAVDECVG